MIIITGASGRLGGALAEAYLAKNKKVVNLSRSQAVSQTQFVKIDLADPDSIKTAAAKIKKMSDKIEVLINCAGVYSEQAADSLTDDQVKRVFATNVEGPMLLTSLLLTKIKKDGADIVNVASTVGTKAYVKQGAYGSSKWAMRGYSANLQIELKDTPCRVISFCPGGFESKLFLKATGQDDTTEGSWMAAEDLAKLIVQIIELPKNMEVSEIIVNRK